MTPPLLSVTGLRKSFPLPEGNELVVLRHVSFTLSPAECVAVMGVSGSGKTTLLHILAGIEAASGGEMKFEPAAVTRGLVFQQHYLLPELDAVENISLGARLRGVARAEALDRAGRLIAEVGLAARARHLPPELSGGERARVALARALAAEPDLILADEPTGNLDEETSCAVQERLFTTVRRARRAMIIVTHEPAVAARADRVLRLEHGELR